MTQQTSLFETPAPAERRSTSAGIALVELVTWASGGVTRSGKLVYDGPRHGFYAMSAHWLSEEEHRTFLAYPTLLKGDRDSWMNAPGSFSICRNGYGWYAVGAGVAMEKTSR